MKKSTAKLIYALSLGSNDCRLTRVEVSSILRGMMKNRQPTSFLAVFRLPEREQELLCKENPLANFVIVSEESKWFEIYSNSSVWERIDNWKFA